VCSSDLLADSLPECAYARVCQGNPPALKIPRYEMLLLTAYRLRVPAADPGAPIAADSLTAFLPMQRTAKLYFPESEAVPQLIRSASQFGQFLAPAGIQQVELRRAMGEAAQAHADQADLAPRVT